jgi:zeaxanthin epoxidase
MVGYKVYIGPKQYFVITDIGNGNYQWYAFLAKPAGSTETEEKPDGSSTFCKMCSPDGPKNSPHSRVTKENEIQQRDFTIVHPRLSHGRMGRSHCW